VFSALKHVGALVKFGTFYYFNFVYKLLKIYILLLLFAGLHFDIKCIKLCSRNSKNKYRKGIF
jgi:hypothetical protein